MAKNSAYNLSSKPVIVLDFYNIDRENDVVFYSGIIDEADKLGYGILHNSIIYQQIHQDINIAGFLTDKLPDYKWVKDIKKQGFNIVRVGHFSFSGENSIPSIIPDLSNAGKLAVEYFAERMFKNIAFAGNDPWGHKPPVLYNSFRDQALKLGLNIHLLQLKHPKKKFDQEKKFKLLMSQFLEWFKSVPKPLGIFTYNDINASRIYTFAMLNGINVPNDIAILGLGNNSVMCNLLPCPLSSIDLNYKEQGRQAVRLLHKLNKKQKITEYEIQIAPKGVVQRQSTNLLSMSDPTVVNAINFIWDNFRKQISIDDVAKFAGVSRSTLSRRFSHFLKHGINAEIRRKRLENSKKLMIGTQMSISKIASESGFPTLTYFHKAFHKAYGITPGEFRKKNTPSGN